MSNKLNPKKFAILSHKLIILCDLMIDTLDEIKDEVEVTGFKQTLEATKKECEQVVEAAFDVKLVSKSTYLQELGSKIDTLLRKNYELIENK